MIQEMFSNMPWLAAIAGGVTYFVCGAVWYGVLGKGWMEAAGLTAERIRTDFKKSNYGITMLMQVVIGISMAGLMSLMGGAEMSVADAVQFGLVVGLVFSGLTTWVHYIYSMQKPALIWYDLGYTTLASILAAVVINILS